MVSSPMREFEYIGKREPVSNDHHTRIDVPSDFAGQRPMQAEDISPAPYTGIDTTVQITFGHYAQIFRPAIIRH